MPPSRANEALHSNLAPARRLFRRSLFFPERSGFPQIDRKRTEPATVIRVVTADPGGSISIPSSHPPPSRVTTSLRAPSRVFRLGRLLLGVEPAIEAPRGSSSVQSGPALVANGVIRALTTGRLTRIRFGAFFRVQIIDQVDPALRERLMRDVVGPALQQSP